MVILVVFKGFLLVKNLEILVQIVPDPSIYYYSCPELVGCFHRCLPSYENFYFILSLIFEIYNESTF